MGDANSPWLILMPVKDNLRHLHDLDDDEPASAAAEIARASKAQDKTNQPRQNNAAALSNVVEQLHIHIITRLETDLAWPHPVWRMAQARVYFGYFS